MNREDVRQFLDRERVYVTGADADAIIRRIDRNGDGRITYTEFSDYLEQGADFPSRSEDFTRTQSYSPTRLSY